MVFDVCAMRYNQEELKVFKQNRDVMASLKRELMGLIYPSVSYMPYFVQFFPQWNNRLGKFKIRDTWSGRCVNEDIITMTKYIIEQLNEKRNAGN